MILVDGLRFRKDGHLWRCVEHPHVEMLCGEVFIVAGQERRFRTVGAALDAAEGAGEGAGELP